MDPLKSNPTRNSAKEALDDFLPRAGRTYQTERNYDYGPEQRHYVSRLSPFIRRRLITEEEVVEAARHRHGSKNAQKFIQEVFWRTYWKGWLEMRPQVWESYLQERRLRLEEIQSGGPRKQAYSRATNAQTGMDAFDAWVRELVETGYLHNHTRMWFASIWIFTLRLPWELGADFFFRHLLDGDPASNTLGWRWVAGIQTPGKHYVATAENISKFTSRRFAPPQLAVDPPPLEYSEDRERRSLPETRSPEELESLPCGLILTPEDCLAEQSPLRRLAVEAVFHGLPTNLYDAFRIALPVRNWTASAIRDAGDRAGAHFRCPVRDTGFTDAYENHLRQWCHENRLKNIVFLLPPVGPWRDFLDSLRESLSKEGIRCHPFRRTWDEELYPKATKGFFAFRKHIPSV
mgnify:CR=1 FL=1